MLATQKGQVRHYEQENSIAVRRRTLVLARGFNTARKNTAAAVAVTSPASCIRLARRNISASSTGVTGRACRLRFHNRSSSSGGGGGATGL